MGHETTMEYGMGYRAFEEGKPLTANPYWRISSNHRKWLAGFNDAMEDAREAQRRELEKRAATIISSRRPNYSSSVPTSRRWDQELPPLEPLDTTDVVTSTLAASVSHRCEDDLWSRPSRPSWSCDSDSRSSDSSSCDSSSSSDSGGSCGGGGD